MVINTRFTVRLKLKVQPVMAKAYAYIKSRSLPAFIYGDVCLEAEASPRGDTSSF